MSQVTIPTDVTEQALPNGGVPETKEKVPSMVANRMAMLEEIDSAAIDEKARLNAEQGLPDPYAAPVATTQQPAAVPAVIAEDALNEVKLRVKVDGKEMELPAAEVVKGYQTDAAAQARLRLVAEQRKQLEAWEQNLNQREAALNTTAPPVTVPAAADLDTGVGVKQALAALAEGDMDEAAKLLGDLIKPAAPVSAPTTPQVDVAALKEQVKSEINTEQEWGRFLQDNPTFANAESQERQYGDYLFISKYGPLVKAGEMSYREALDETAKEVKTVFSPPPATPTAPVVPQSQEVIDRKERKEKIDALPTAAGRAVTTQEQQEDDSPAATIAEMRKARGLPV